ncbi:unnamed protein product [Durusdinium trenchii]|uniref:Uncharacterized protein n=1 Tax=Durusdinium trenchii TaxID=1381693 RepID=A0ABP0HTS2_9DINO
MKIMWVFLLLQLTVQLAWCQETLDAGNCSSHEPACDDKTAMLQFQVEQPADKCTAQEEEDLNKGTCGADSACRCTPDPDGQSIGPFNLGGLRCAGQNSCRSDSNAQADKDKFFTFSDSSNYLDCSGRESCRVFWNVQNVGAACCSDQNACHNEARIHSLFCADNGACDQIDAEITGDFYCQAKQGCGDQTTGANKGGFAFSSGDHSVTCNSEGGAGDDQGSCQKAAMTFGAGSNVKMTCTGFKACFKAELTLSSGTCLSLSCSGDNACADIQVDLNGGACSCTGVNCPTTRRAGRDIPVCQATCAEADALSSTGSYCCAGTSGGKPDASSIDCSQCCPTVTTTAADPGTTSTAASGGDPHIASFHGAHYTLLKDGSFKAWTFTRDTSFHSKHGLKNAKVDFQLLAKYGGPKFETRGLLLLDKTADSLKTLELTSKDCVWRVREGEDEWRDAKAELLSSEDHVTSVNISEPHKTDGNNPQVVSELYLKMTDRVGMPSGRKVARLYTQCTPDDHLDFKMAMYEKEDIDVVGGELGVHSEEVQSAALLSTNTRMMHVRTDDQYQVKQPWVELGGTKSGASYLESETDHASSLVALAMPPCTEAQEEAAASICAKHLPKDASSESEVFADCIFDVCHGGGEKSAQLAAALIKA